MSTLVLHGPDPERLEDREAQAHGSATLHQINADRMQLTAEGSTKVATGQDDRDAALIDRVHAAQAAGHRRALAHGLSRRAMHSC